MRRALTAALLLTAALGLHPASAARLPVAAVPLQSWAVEVEVPELPPTVSRSHLSERVEVTRPRDHRAHIWDE